MAKLLPPWTPFQEMTTLVLNGVKTLLPGGGFDKCYRNSRYLVLLRRVNFPEPFGRGLHLSIRGNDRRIIHDWREMQRIKNEILGPEAEAIELYPATSRLVDAANQYHIWYFPDLEMNFGFDKRDVSDETQSIYNSKQRPFEPGMLEALGGLHPNDEKQIYVKK